MQQLAVADALHGEVAGGLQQGAGGPAQHPPALLFAGVAEALPGVPEQVRQEFPDEHAVGQRHVHPPLGGRRWSPWPD
ncbi:hypothetical protein TPA0907_02860 [Micromonospora humidisoli]|nr:hypothetical protein TPA0907_02860 [Micromonospora sp. AKA109]